MDPIEFAAESRLLARPRLNLCRWEKDGEVVGVWGGTGLNPPLGR